VKAAVGSCLAACAAVAGCSSQIDSISTPVVAATSTTPGGIYFGTFSSQSSGTSVAVIGLVDETDHIVAYAQDGSFLLSGLYTTTTGSDGLTAAAHDYPLTSSGSITDLNLVGTYVSQSSISLSYTSSSGDAGTLSLTFEATLYDQASATADLAGTWVTEDVYGDTLQSFSIGNTGSVTGTTTSPACTYSGTAAVEDIRYNLYSLSLSESCTSSSSSSSSSSSGGSSSSSSSSSGGTSSATLSGMATILPPSTTLGNTKDELVLIGTDSTEARLFTLSPGS
jgi:hypothetical protein